jgi:glutamate dehydrogenase/leucine dehydrogenase
MNTFEQMMQRGHERICFHTDPCSGLRAIIAVHSTKLGNALGGTRRWHYATESDALYDVLRLSEGMTYKAACAGLPMGGAKSVVLLPEYGHCATEAEACAMGRFVETFNGHYIAAEDVGVTPQYVDWMASETKHVMGGVTVSTGGDPSPYTAQGVINGMKACLAHIGLPANFDGLTVAVQGLGHVGMKVASTLVEAGAKVLAAEINSDALQYAADEFGIEPVEDDSALFAADCDILAPCALGGVINGNMVHNLRCKILCGGANNILDDPDEDAARLAKAGIVYAPDFVVNAGGLIRLAGLYLNMSEEELDVKVAQIEPTTAHILRQWSSMTSTHAAAVAVAQQRINEGAKEQVHAG